MKLSIAIQPEDGGKKVGQLLKSRLHLSVRLIKKLKLRGNILLNSEAVHANAVAREGDLLEVVVDTGEYNDSIVPEKMDIEILYEGDGLIAVNKPAGIVVHPSCMHQEGTVANGLMHYLLEKGVKTLVRPVSRLDRDTSGVIVFALNPYVQECLLRQMRSRTYVKEYIGIVHGIIEENSGTISLPIERLPGSIMLRRASAAGVPAVTRYEVMERFDNATLLKFFLETGKTHQIRVHCQATGHPLVGDTLYSLPGFDGANAGIISRHALHSRRAAFIHPATGKSVELEAPVPADFLSALEILRNKRI